MILSFLYFGTISYFSAAELFGLYFLSKLALIVTQLQRGWKSRWRKA